MSRIIASLLAVAGSLGCAIDATALDSAEREPVVGGPCEGCEIVFAGMPPGLASRSRLAPPDEPGPPMLIEGTVRDADGRPASGVIVYAYHTDPHGTYPRPDESVDRAVLRHGRLRGWAKTGDDGRYTFDTIRPGGYPESSVPSHVHMHVIETGRCTYYIDDILFDDDPRLTDAMRQRMITGRGGAGLVAPTRDGDGTWIVTRDIVLGEEIPGYAACGRSSARDER